MTEHHASLIRAAETWVTLDDAQRNALAASFTVRTLAERDHLALHGATHHEVLFVTEGVLRFYYPSDYGRESNKAFPRSVKRGILEWISTSKWEVTRAKRIEETARRAQRNERADQWSRS